jgi:hypothetical protein
MILIEPNGREVLNEGRPGETNLFSSIGYYTIGLLIERNARMFLDHPVPITVLSNRLNLFASKADR